MKELDENQLVAIDERIDKFLKGLMSAEEEVQFKKDIASDAFLKQRCKERLMLIKGIKAYGKHQDSAVIDAAKKATEKDINQVVNRKYKKSKVISLSRIVWVPMSIAAGLIACFIINSRLIDSYAMDFANAQSSGMISFMDSEFRGGTDKELFNKLDKLFKNVQESNDLDNTIAYLSKEFDISRDEYVDDEDEYSSRIGWFLAVAYLKNGDKDKAKETLQAVINDNSNATDAKELLEKLNKTFFF